MYVKGVNLGNWLVLEKWMNPALFYGTDAEDEYYLPRRLSPEAYEARIKIHRSEYITERDFAAIKRMGLNAVRIPVPYFIFGDREPFIGCIEELDKAFAWAEKYGLKILIDLHTAPMGQNGFDNGGICGVCKWSQTPKEVDFVLSVLERLAKRYGNREGLFGIEALNEPITSPNFDIEELQSRYVPVDREMAKGSATNTLEFLRDFYDRAYDRLRPNMAEDKWVVFHDGFQMTVWKDFITQPRFRNVMLDTHLYLMGFDAGQGEENLDPYLDRIRKDFGDQIAQVQEYVPVVCGEWCLSNACASGLEPEAAARIYKQIGEAQLASWKRGSGYFYWSYKLLLDTVNGSARPGMDSWDLGKSVDMGWITL